MTSSLAMNLVSTLAAIRTGLDGIVRWQKFIGTLPVRHETCLEHSFDAVLLTVLVIEHIRAASPLSRFDAYGLVACAALHDVGEIRTGDIAYADKRPFHATNEALAFREEFGWLDAQVAKSLERIYALQGRDAASALAVQFKEDMTTLIFEFVERYGYLLYAIEQYQHDPGNVALVRHVVRNQLDRIVELVRLIPGLSGFMAAEFAVELRAT